VLFLDSGWVNTITFHLTRWQSASCVTPSCCLAWQHPMCLVTIAFCYCTLHVSTPGGAGYTWQFRMTPFCTLFPHNLSNVHVTKAFFPGEQKWCRKVLQIESFLFMNWRPSIVRRKERTWRTEELRGSRVNAKTEENINKRGKRRSEWMKSRKCFYLMHCVLNGYSAFFQWSQNRDFIIFRNCSSCYKNQQAQFHVWVRFGTLFSVV